MLGLGLGLTSPAAFGGATVPWEPIAGAAIDMDFARGRYWWSGAEKTTANFTTFVLNGSTLDATGLTCSATVDISLSLSGLGTYVPGAAAVAFTHASLPGTNRTITSLDDTTNTERALCVQTTAGALGCTVIDGNVSQAVPAVTAATLAVKHGFAASYTTNSVMVAVNGAAATADVVATMPTVTTLRIGRNAVGTAQPTGPIARLAFFTATKTQPELNALSIVMRDSS